MSVNTPPLSSTIPIINYAPRSVVPPTPPNVIPISQTRLPPPRFPGFVSPNTPVISSNNPVSVTQTINAPVIPVTRTTSTPIVPVAVIPTTSTRIPASPSARSALLNLSSTPSQSDDVRIPNMSPRSRLSQPPSDIRMTTPSQSDDVRVPNMSPRSRLSQPPPDIRMSTPNSNLPFRQTTEIMDQEFQITDYQGILANSSLENELLNAGYAPLSKIVVRTESGEKRTQYIKAINKNGQKVFILIDVNGYTTARASDLTLMEAQGASIIPYSIKTGAYECANKDVCGVAFECGADAVCVLSRGSDDLNPKEANFVFVEQQAPSAASIETKDGTIMSYPVIRLSEIRVNPELILSNTDEVTKRLRNAAYSSLIQELAEEERSILNLNAAFGRFKQINQGIAIKLNETLSLLNEYNKSYIANPPRTDEYKDRYRELQFNLAHRNEGIETLLRLMKKVADKRPEIDVITNNINEITQYAIDQFVNIEGVRSEKSKSFVL